MLEIPEKKGKSEELHDSSIAEEHPVELKRLLELLHRSEELSRKAAASGRALGMLSDADLKIRLR